MKKRLVASLIGLALFGGTANASPIIDQNQSLNSGTFAILIPSPVVAQSFQQTANNISGAGIFLSGSFGSGTTDITISLWTGLPTFGGTFITSGTATASARATWVDVFWTPVAVTPGSTAYLTISSSAQFSNYGVTYGAGNPYAAGVAIYNVNPLNSEYDLTFRTYSDTDFNAPVPAPIVGAGLPGLAVALGGLVAWRRRRNQATVA